MDLPDQRWFSQVQGGAPRTCASEDIAPTRSFADAIAACHRAVAEIVAGFDGFVAQYMGDGVLLPRAHEDDAKRVVRAGLGVIDAVRRLDVNLPKSKRASASPPGWWSSAI